MDLVSPNAEERRDQYQNRFGRGPPQSATLGNLEAVFSAETIPGFGAPEVPATFQDPTSQTQVPLIVDSVEGSLPSVPSAPSDLASTASAHPPPPATGALPAQPAAGGAKALPAKPTASAPPDSKDVYENGMYWK